MKKTKLTTEDIQKILEQKGNILLENLDSLEEVSAKIAFNNPSENNIVLIKNCKNLKAISLDVTGAYNVEIQDCPLLKEISLICATGDIFIENCLSLSSFTKTISVGGCFTIRECPALENIPEITGAEEININSCNNLKTVSQICVQGDIQIIHCEKLEMLSSIFVKECFILCCPSLVSLGETVQVRESLHISNCKNLKKLPENTIVGELSLKKCPSLEVIPQSLSICNGYFSIIDCAALKELPKNLIVGALSLKKCPSLEAIPQSLSIINGQFSIIDCAALKELPKNLIVGENFWVKNCPNLIDLPERFFCGGCLYLDATGIKALPADLIVGGSITVKPQKIETIPDTIKVGGQLFNEDCPQYGFSQNEYCEGRYFYLSAEKRLLLIDSTQQQDGYTMLSFINDTERIVAFDDEHFFVHALEDGELSADRFAEIIKGIVQSGLSAAY